MRFVEAYGTLHHFKSTDQSANAGASGLSSGRGPCVIRRCESGIEESPNAIHQGHLGFDAVTLPDPSDSDSDSFFANDP